MTTERWRRVQAAFIEIADLPKDQQSEALNRLGSEIREEVAVMLAADDPDIDSPINEEWEGSVHEALSGLSEAEAPERVGPWRIVRELGRGGMGIVYLAERADGQFEQRVALKLVKRGMDTDAIIARFLNERQVLATLQHPHIARLYDGGITEEGQPYFAMEYVDGVPITDYCNENGLSINERLELLVSVCRAVAHAHNQLIIHRDLKPSNILVTGNGEPHLLDFGLAKVLQDPTGDPATTRPEQRWMTLDYASPEQVKGETVGTPSDTYQLGLVLYEMLTGQRAYTVKDLSPTEAERVICEVDPPRPSIAVVGTDGVAPHHRAELQPNRLRKRLKGDVDTILLKALHKDASRGYASAETLASDIQRHLDGLPIHARPDTLGYRAAKFVRRHRWGTAATAIVFLLIVTGGIALLVQNRRIARESERARIEAEKAGQVTDYLVGIFEASDPNVAQGDTITARELLDRGLEHAAELDDQPELQATLLGVTGRIYSNLGDLQQAEALFRQSLVAWDTVDRGPEQEEEYTQTLFGLAMAIATGRREGYSDAESLLRRVIERREAENVEDKLYQEALSTLIGTLYAMGRNEAADSTYAMLEATLERVPRPAGPNAADHLLKLAAVMSDRGRFHGDLETLFRGQRLFDEAISDLRTEHTSRHSRVGFALNMLAENLIAGLDLDPAQSDLLAKADSVTLESVLLHRTLLPDLNPTLTRSLLNRAVVLRKLRRYAEAEETIVEALNIAEAQHGKEHYSRVVFNEELARIQLEAGNYAGAATRFADTRDWWIQTYGNGHLKNLEIDIELAAALTGAGRFAEAETYLEGAYETLTMQPFESQRGRADRDTRMTLQHLVDLYTRWDKPERAAEYRALLGQDE